MNTNQKPSLPSIKEMFPEYLMRVPPHLISPPPMTSPEFQQRFSRISNQSRPRSQTSSTNPTGCIRSSHRRHSTSQGSQVSPILRGQSPTSITMPPLIRSSHVHLDRLAVQPEKDKASRKEHSFDILRSGPSSVSRQHINSSHVYPTRKESSHEGHTQDGLSNGSAPVFQVIIPPSDPHPRAQSKSSRHTRSPDQSHRRVESNTHITSGQYNYSSIIFPVNGSASGSMSHRELSPNDGSNGSDDDDLSGSNSGKKHVCSTCFKRFNRPSSLRIHVNTHTGATPFPCPWPNCGREFNVNSNMRRHYRNHNAPGLSRPSSKDNRRRRRRAPPQGAPHGGGDSALSTIHILAEHHLYITSPPTSNRGTSEDSDDNTSDTLSGVPPQNKGDLQSPYEVFSPHHHGPVGKPPGTRGASDRLDREHMGRRQYSQTQPHILHLSPTSPSPTSPLPEPVYSPSAPYVRSLADSRVSTALRPAFHSPPLPRKPIVKQEMTSDVL